jgi:DNA-binding transcriptional LysR family regulator
MNGDKAMLATAYRYFLAVAEVVAASAVNRQILQLEAALGIPLFERVGRGLRLSEAGRVLGSHLRRAVGDYQGVISELDALRGLQRGKVSLATVLRGPMGFGRASRLHTAKILRLSEDLPVVVEIVDAD